MIEAAGAAGICAFPDAGATWHPGRSASLRIGRRLGWGVRLIEPRRVAALDEPGGTVAAELYLDACRTA